MKNPTILIVEDEKDLRELYTLRLQWDSFKVLFAEDGEEALKKAFDEKPDLILLDIMMPKKSGIEVLKELKSNPSTSKIPVIVLTALSNDKLKEETDKLGANHYLIKSETTPADVINMVKKQLGVK